MRKLQFKTGEYYHIYNRGVDKRDIFIDDKDYIRFLRSIKEFNQPEPIESLYRLDQIRKKEQKETKLLRQNFCRSNLVSSLPLVKFVCYSLLPNHYHFLLKQQIKNGISIFMQKLGLGYTAYFNSKYKRSGALFQGTYKSTRIDSDEYLLYLSGYINGNTEIHKIAKAENWTWSSFKDYLELRNGTLCDKNLILNQFKNIQDYQNYVNIIIRESGQLKDEIKKYLLE